MERFFRDRMIRDYDRCMAPFERRLFAEARARLVTLASGRVLEVGAGTGANFCLYPDRVDRVAAIDPELGMLAQAGRKRDAARAPVDLVAASAEALPFPPSSFDAVVATLVFCTIPDPAAALGEVVRVMRPGARLLMLEHVRSRTALLRFLQDVATPVQRIVAAGCHLNRPTRSLVERSGLLVTATRERFAATVVEIEALRVA